MAKVITTMTAMFLIIMMAMVFDASGNVAY